MSIRILAGLALLLSFTTAPCLAAEDPPPKVGDMAADFELTSMSGAAVRLSDELKVGPVVLVVLRGFPGYQCPACNQQVGQFLAQADKFKAAGAKVLLVYPGPAKGLNQKAAEFIQGKTVPAHFELLVDPDYTFTKAYHLRWNEAGETAYPSTFVIQKDRKITFAKVSKSHGGRTKPDEVLSAITSRP